VRSVWEGVEPVDAHVKEGGKMEQMEVGASQRKGRSFVSIESFHTSSL
jgi:hypothetical protein